MIHPTYGKHLPLEVPGLFEVMNIPLGIGLPSPTLQVIWEDHQGLTSSIIERPDVSDVRNST
jgi:hypothetical protein